MVTYPQVCDWHSLQSPRHLIESRSVLLLYPVFSQFRKSHTQLYRVFLQLHSEHLQLYLLISQLREEQMQLHPIFSHLPNQQMQSVLVYLLSNSVFLLSVFSLVPRQQAKHGQKEHGDLTLMLLNRKRIPLWITPIDDQHAGCGGADFADMHARSQQLGSA